MANSSVNRQDSAADAEFGMGAAPRDEAWLRLRCHRDPFADVCDPSLFHASSAARGVQSALLRSLQPPGGCVLLVTGPSGLGKTLQMRVLQTVLYMAGENIVVHQGDRDPAPWLARVAMRRSDDPHRVIDIVDGIERGPPRALQFLTHLIRSGAGEGLNARVVITARPELEPALGDVVGAAIAAQVRFAWLRLAPLTRDEVEALIIHRLQRSGYAGPLPLPAEAIDRIAERSAGVPRAAIALAAEALESQQRRSVAVESEPEPERAPAPRRPLLKVVRVAGLAAAASAAVVLPFGGVPVIGQFVDRMAPMVAVGADDAQMLSIRIPVPGGPTRTASAPPAATADAATSSSAVAPSENAEPTPKRSPSDADVEMLLRRGGDAMRSGAVQVARVMFERIAAAGDARGMHALAASYDAYSLSLLGISITHADPSLSEYWHRQAMRTSTEVAQH